MQSRKNTYIDSNVSINQQDDTRTRGDVQDIDRLQHLLPIDDEKVKALLTLLMLENHKILRLSLLESF
ncbi:hypothetical protein [Dictyobacter vulcani]|uniref:hypothetical protein n=1 Tax=Dictyobacter vulcani TaxID=2607529 RepID=UPI0012508ABC|nr:hypothetical protein [Dictyobacter vulcani]